MDWIIQSERLNFRKINMDDFSNLKVILQDIEIMYAWEHAFTDDEVYEWIEKNMARYNSDGYSYFAAIDKKTNNFVGVIGPLVEEIEGVKYIGIAYILNKKYWGMGYATEGATACINYAFDILHADKIIAQIRPNNLPSRRVAEKLNMKIEGQYIKNYNNTDMPHLIYSLTK
ncbi:MAG: GNAT family N-acetyltransferase [Clostridia bacterium]|nr:GNAT family N-acetyltransferase [Clostridia bacterium]